MKKLWPWLIGLGVLTALAAFLRLPAWPFDYEQITVKNRDRMTAVHEANERLENDHHAPSKTRLSFYGQVLDEKDQPLSNVRVTMRWPNYYSFDGHVNTASMQSDTRGCFSLTGQHGDRLKVILDKPGYYVPLEIKQTSFEFFQPGNETIGRGEYIYYYEPDEAHPFVFRLRKKGGSSALIHKHVEVLPPVDGASVRFDFIGGKIVSDGGQMIIQTWKHVREHYPFDWRVVLSIPDGGFTQRGAQGEFAFDASKDGYEPTKEWSFHATSPIGGGNSGMFEQLYFCYGEPKRYGRLRITTEGVRQTVELEYVLNPKPGDHNLEYNPENSP